MRSFLAAIVLSLAMGPQAAQAQNLIAAYFAHLSPVDFQNSRGVRLSDFGAILQQDRANFHRFGRADPLDEWDPVFADPGHRAQIPRIWRSGPGSEYIPDWVASGNTRYVYVEIYGFGGVPSFIVVHEGAG
jgi:hypothetical protein